VPKRIIEKETDPVPMKVLHITPYMHPSAGGPPVVVEKLAELSPAFGWEAAVVTTTLLCAGDAGELETGLKERIPVRFLKADRPKLFGLSSEALPVLDGEVRRAELVHVHTLWHPLNGLARRLCARYGKPYVIMPHGMLDPYSLSVKSLKKRLYLRFFERRNLVNARAMLYTTEEERRLAEKALPWLPAGMVVPLGAGPPPAVPPAELEEMFLRQFPAARGKRRILYLSRLHPKKGLDRLLGALPHVRANCPDAQLVIAGNGDPAFRNELESTVRAALPEGSVLFTGMLQGELKWGAYAAAEMFTLPSRQENFALVVAEAMLMGLPVIITDRVNIWPDVEQAAAGIVLREDNCEAFLPAAIGSLLDPSGAGREMGRRGRELAMRQFTWKNSAKAMTDCYNSILNRGKGRPRDAG
jgi:glycosyltransferase involved in cell wall biosynthesis